jgi:hypothetical protein
MAIKTSQQLLQTKPKEEMNPPDLHKMMMQVNIYVNASSLFICNE